MSSLLQKFLNHLRSFRQYPHLPDYYVETTEEDGTSRMFMPNDGHSFFSWLERKKKPPYDGPYVIYLPYIMDGMTNIIDSSTITLKSRYGDKEVLVKDEQYLTFSVNK